MSTPRKRPGGTATNRTHTAPISSAFPGGTRPWPPQKANANNISAPSAAPTRVSTPNSSDSPTATSPIVTSDPKILGCACAAFDERQEQRVGLVVGEPAAEGRGERIAVQPVALQLPPPLEEQDDPEQEAQRKQVGDREALGHGSTLAGLMTFHELS